MNNSPLRKESEITNSKSTYDAPPLLSIVVPIYNEEEVISEFLTRIYSDLINIRKNCELILINDGSSDKTDQVIKEAITYLSSIKYLKLSRNFGHQNAVMAGLSYAKGDLVAIIDADLQDNPAHLLAMEKLITKEVYIVYGKRQSRLGESLFKRLTASIFYRVLNILSNIEIPHDTGDFRIARKEVVDTILQMNERDPFLRGLFALTGYNAVPYPYVRDPRYAGETKYPLRKMLSLGLKAILSFSDKPLRLVLNFAFICLLISTVSFVGLISNWLVGRHLAGWASLFFGITFFGSLNLLTLAMIGQYVLTIWRSTQGRPGYVVQECIEC